MENLALNTCSTSRTSATNLANTYQANSNKIQAVADNSGENSSFTDATGSTDYTYYTDGSLKSDANKGITLFEYNYLKLPKKVTFSDGKTIVYQYSATGAKLKETTSTGDITDYVGNVIYKNALIYQVSNNEGRSVNNVLEYDIKDHLGSLRVSFKDSLGIAKVTQESHTGVFGEVLPSLVYTNTPKTDNFDYTGHERLKTFNLGYIDAGARLYDPLVPRFTTLDPLCEISRRFSPTVYANNNPIRFIDPDGMQAKDVYLVGEQREKAFEQLQASTSLTLSMNDKTGKVTATGEAKTEADKTLQEATTDKNVNVIVETTNGSQTIGVFDGNEMKDGKVNTFQYVNPENTAKVDGFTERPSGNTILHETLESYVGGLNTLKTGIPAKSTDVISNEQNQEYKNAHNEANKIDPRHKENYDGYYTEKGTKLQRLDNPKKTMLLPLPKRKN